MAVSTFFNNYNRKQDQELMDDLLVESIRIHGVDTVYVARKTDNVDKMMNEDDTAVFYGAYEMEMYVKNVDNFGGQGDFMSKFGLQINDTITMSLAIRTFNKYATRVDPDLTRPREGDLVYLPMNKKFFEVMHVEHESVFYQFGSLRIYDLKLELFQYSNEIFETGNITIDQFHDGFKTATADTLEELHDLDPIANNIFFEDESNEILDFSVTDPFSEIIERPTDR